MSIANLYPPNDLIFWDFRKSIYPKTNQGLHDFIRDKHPGNRRHRDDLFHNIKQRVDQHDKITTERNASDAASKDQVIDELDNIKGNARMWYALERTRMLEILSYAKSPVTNYDTNGDIANTDALLLKPDGLAAILQKDVFYNGPVFIKDLADAPYTTLDAFMDLELNDRKMIQVACGDRPQNSPRPRNMPVPDFKAAVKQTGHKSFPFNSLDINCDVNTGLRLKEFENEECRFMPRLFGAYADGSGRRAPAPELWALVGNGALTLPHMDSHGYSTYLRVVEGQVGFVWLSHPDDETVSRWLKDPVNETEFDWKFRIVNSGQAVYFPAGTIHAVFRSRTTGPTFILGGHILRWSTIDEWARVCALQCKESNSTNEDVRDIPELVWSGAQFIAEKASRISYDKLRRFWEFAKQIHPKITPELAGDRTINKLPAIKKRKRDEEAEDEEAGGEAQHEDEDKDEDECEEGEDAEEAEEQ